MYLKSRYPDLPTKPTRNIHHLLFNRPEQSLWPDFTSHIDLATGQQIRFREFLRRIRDGATALVTPPSEGGLGVEAKDGEIIGILSHNSSVSLSTRHLGFSTA